MTDAGGFNCATVSELTCCRLFSSKLILLFCQLSGTIEYLLYNYERVRPARYYIQGLFCMGQTPVTTLPESLLADSERATILYSGVIWSFSCVAEASLDELTSSSSQSYR